MTTADVNDLVPHTCRDLMFGTAAGCLAYDDTFDEPLDEITGLFAGA